MNAEPRPTISRRQLLLGVLLLGAVLAGAYGNVVFRGHTLVATSNYHPFDDRWDRLRSGGLAPPAYLNWYDPGAAWWQWEPAGQFFTKAFRRGELPLWDPSVGGGVDAHVNVTQGQYFPPYALLLLAGNTPGARDLYSLGMLLIGGGGVFLLLRRNGLHFWSAATAGAAFMLSGSLTFNVNSIVGQSIAVIPLVVLAADALLDRPTWARSAWLALAVGFAISASFLPVALSALCLVPFQLLARLLVRGGNPARRLSEAGDAVLKTAAGGALGLALAAAILLPVHMASARDPQFRGWYAGLGLQHYRGDVLLTLLSPKLTYSVAQAADPRTTPFPLPYDWVAAFFYAGLIPLGLIAFAWADRRPDVRRLLVFFLTAGAFLLLKLMGIPPAQWIGHLPVFHQIHFIPYFSGALGLCIAGLAGLGVEGLARARPGRAGWIGSAAIIVLALLLVAGFWSTHTAQTAPAGRTHLREAARLCAISLVLLAGAALRSRGRLSGGAAGALGFACVVLELGPLAYRPRFLRHDVWNDPPPYVRALQADPSLFRVHGVGDMALTANVFQGLGLSAISSRHAFNAPRYDELLRRYFGNPPSHFPVATLLLPTRRSVLDMLGVKYLVSYAASPEQEAGLLGQGFLLAVRDERFTVWRNPRAWSRAYVATKLRRAAGPEQALGMVGELEAPDEAVVEAAPPPASLEAAPSGPSEAEILDYEPDRVRVRARSPGPASLILSDVLAPGWRATVNGRETAVWPANYAFRGVRIPGGESVVEFRYRTPGLITGLIVSGTALALIVAALGGAALRRRRVTSGGAPSPG